MEITCKKCGSIVDPQDSFCPNCGLQQNRSEKGEESINLGRGTTINTVTRPRKFYRSREDKWIAGVCGGLGEYFNIDPNLIRIVLIALLISGGVFTLFWSEIGLPQYLNLMLSLVYISLAIAFKENPNQLPPRGKGI